VLTHRPAGTVGFGLGGPEVGIPRSLFAEPFRIARAEGLHSLPHAGETTGPESVWSALRDLGAERIGHGLHAVEDPELLDHLARERILLEVCPTSNLRTGEVVDLAEHPLPLLHRRGVPVTINTDDPGMFGCDLVGEYRAAHDRMGLTPAELADIARAGVEAAYCAPALKTEILAAIDALPVPA
jgi:aminodeoxyfutalosine deaminase